MLETVSNHRISIIVIALLILSWWGILDSLSIIVNTESIKDAAIIYGVARSINGVISCSTKRRNIRFGWFRSPRRAIGPNE